MNNRLLHKTDNFNNFCGSDWIGIKATTESLESKFWRMQERPPSNLPGSAQLVEPSSAHTGARSDRDTRNARHPPYSRLVSAHADLQLRNRPNTSHRRFDPVDADTPLPQIPGKPCPAAAAADLRDNILPRSQTAGVRSDD